ncbi:hypothetical protein HBO23_07360 [Pseudomonas sp. WS 5532]|uniref:hypothetical protein n=1 Tax=Pseudomonas TaxID=286 RepID=UPI00147442CD|nr:MULTISPECIES: hypothetical protein [Pseudomonas]MCK3840342.1 hypothetical protein [Pseudomonas sp. NCIMB 10586]MCK3846764.1 hypothetical protein [Pseudomonas sp. W15Feb34]NMX72778.1 hypothetical protein [Pseudomonas sp. WS 5532]QXI56495.1 hypothetical protein HU759_015285 [Pseudomonas sp. OE 28.3]VCU62966.1 Hypothetical new protein [Pseudomonas synxantha]
MNKVAFACLLTAVATLPALAMADLILEGKVSSNVSAYVKPNNNLFVTDDKGSWFDQGLEMSQLGGWDMPYEVQARLRVVSSTGVFQVRLDEPLQIRNAGNVTQVFQRPKVDFMAEGEAPKTLMVGQGTEFKNPPRTVPGEDTSGYYGLTVAAYPPEGDFKQTAGAYSGVLSLTFEPVITDP